MSQNPAGIVDFAKILSYLGLPADYQPNPESKPVKFLQRHLRELPPHLSSLFSTITTPKQRTAVPVIRNRRLRYTETDPPELHLDASKVTWLSTWQAPQANSRPGEQEAAEEREWVEKEFLGSLKPHVGKLGALLAGYEEDRAFERARAQRRADADRLDSMPEEEDESDEEEVEGEEETQPPVTQGETSNEENRALFLRSVRERFIYGLLEGIDGIDYDKIDWDERWDAVNDRDAEERWFDEEEESSEVAPSFPEV